jgi:hypothetical protein
MPIFINEVGLEELRVHRPPPSTTPPDAVILTVTIGGAAGANVYCP